MSEDEDKILPCEDCGHENPAAHDYCSACGNYLRDDALRIKDLGPAQQLMLKHLERRLQPARIAARENRNLLGIGLVYLSVTGGYLFLKMLPAFEGIEFIYLTLRFSEIGLPLLLVFLMRNRKYQAGVLAYTAILLFLFLWQNFM
jgi:hypothetical protein